MNPQAINDYLEERASGHRELARLLKLALAKPLSRRAENLRPLSGLPEDAAHWAIQKAASGVTLYEFAPDASLEGNVRHVADWLRSALLEDAAWLKQIDPNQQGKPQRFKKIDSLERAIAEADNDMRIKNKALANTLQSVPAGEGEKEVAKLSEDFRIVQLLSPAALGREGVAMGHCIGQGAYDEELTSGLRQYYSLRDAHNRPHATLEVATATQEIKQCQGKGNQPPVARYRPWIAQWIQECGLTLVATVRDCGLVQSVDGSVYNLDAMPEGTKVARSLDLSGMELESLPAGLEVGGDLDLTHSRVKRLPDRLKVTGNLYMADSKIPQLPEGLEVGGGLYLASSEVSQLPEGLKVGGDLYLGWTNITQLPEGFEVGGTLQLKYSAVKSLPAGLKVGGSLSLAGSKITRLPDGLRVNGMLNIRHTNISELPRNLEVGDLYLGWSEVKQLPESLRVAGDLDLKNTEIQELPSGLEVGRDLDLRGTKVNSLPDDIKIGGSLCLEGSKVTQLPDGLEVGGKVFGLPTHTAALAETRLSTPCRER